MCDNSACRIFIVVACLLVEACASLPSETLEPSYTITTEDLLSGSVLPGSSTVRLPKEEPLAVDQQMIAFLQQHVDRRATEALRLQQLVFAVISDGSFGLQYTEHTRTAAGTFHGRNGNCLSFTNMFVAMAREIGLKARFQQVDIPPDWEREGDMLLLNRHVNVLVELGASGRKVVDFNMDDFDTRFDRRVYGAFARPRR